MSETSWNNFGRRDIGQGVDSMYQLVAVAAQRNKQLVRGASPRISVGPLMHKNTTIALEEARRGLVPFTMSAAQEKNGDGGNAPSEPVVSAVAAAGVQSQKGRREPDPLP
ncbi:MAG TPA: DNA-directed RNA polymerase subunit omega [Pyrinomonadaceae bacterium]|nr:DNA-directed RNA polymerase subunit omega [Pyrinomonadaceae bacterium]